MSKSKKSGDGWKIFGILILIIIVMLGIAGLVVYAISSNEEEEIDEIIEDEDIEDPSYHVHHWQVMNDSVSHWNYCPLCNQVDSDSFESHNFSDVMVVYPYDYNDGYSQYTCDVCGYSFIDVIPWDDKYLPDGEDPDVEEPDYGDPDECAHSYVYVYDDNSHWFQCELCGEELDGSEQVHSLSLLSDSSGHYNYCDVCGYESSVTSHSFTSGYDDINHYSECKTCGYQTNVEAHSKVGVTSNGSTGHIYKCSCGYSFGNEDHNYGSIYNVITSYYDYHYYDCKDCAYSSKVHSSAGRYCVDDMTYGQIGGSSSNLRYTVTAHCSLCSFSFTLGTIYQYNFGRFCSCYSGNYYYISDMVINFDIFDGTVNSSLTHFLSL